MDDQSSNPKFEKSEKKKHRKHRKKVKKDVPHTDLNSTHDTHSRAKHGSQSSEKALKTIDGEKAESHHNPKHKSKKRKTDAPVSERTPSQSKKRKRQEKSTMEQEPSVKASKKHKKKKHKGKLDADEHKAKLDADADVLDELMTLTQTPNAGNRSTTRIESNSTLDDRIGKQSVSETQEDIYKKGKWSSREDICLRNAIDDYIQSQNFGFDGYRKLIKDSMRLEKKSGPWMVIRQAVSRRSRRSVYDRGRLYCEEQYISDKKGKWTEEEVELLKALVAEHGMDWSNISPDMGRIARRIQSKWRSMNTVAKKTGRWSDDDVKELKRLADEALKEAKVSKHKFRNSLGMDWRTIAQKMERTENSVSSKYFDAFFIKKGVKWTEDMDEQLVEHVRSQGYEDLDEIVWADISKLMGSLPYAMVRCHWSRIVGIAAGVVSISEPMKYVLKKLDTYFENRRLAREAAAALTASTKKGKKG